jgi:hypothetical protein
MSVLHPKRPTCCTISARMGAVNTAGRLSCAELLSPSTLWIETIGLEAAMMSHLFHTTFIAKEGEVGDLSKQ